MMMHRPTHAQPRGFVLIVAIGFLLVMSILALLAVNGLLVQNAMAAAASSRAMAFQAADAALAQTEGTLLAQGGYAAGPSWFSVTTATTTPSWQVQGVWASGNTLVYPATNGLPEAQVVVEKLPSVAISGGAIASNAYGGGTVRIAIFRLTAHALGPDGHQQATIQTTFHL